MDTRGHIFDIEILVADRQEAVAAKRARWLRRENRRLRWTPGGFTLRLFSGSHPSSRVRRDVALRCFQSRHFRLGVTILFLPEGYSISKVEPRG